MSVNSHSQKLVVIGNGPSLKDFDFNNFRGLKTLGMNAAYRYWERINWYPTYYCCLDDRLLETHYQQIYDLLMTEKVERIFVTYRFLDFYPQLATHPRVDVLDSFVSHRYQTRHQQYGFPRKEANSFLTDYPKKLTTGCYSIRYGIYLGYRQILLLGIDCRYVPVVTGARVVDELKMVMDETPQSNQNYFFDDYQQAGDVFQIPNPEVHGGNLHLQSFEALRDDIPNYTPGVEIINCNKQSELYVYNVFPYQTFEVASCGNKLGAVVVPTIKFELERILENFKLWNQLAYLPYLQPPDKPSTYLHFVFNAFRDEAMEEQITEAFKAAKLVAKCFQDIRFSYCELSGMDDIYRRSYQGEVGSWGYKSGPNNQFFMTIEKFSADYPYIFMMETDCFPVKANWLQRAAEIANNSERFWIKGSLYRGNSPIMKSQQDHINGNALYASGDRDFQCFIREVWKPFVLKNTKEVDRTLAYDCAIARYFDKAESATNNFPWLHWQNTAHLLTYTNFIQNHSGGREAKGEDEITLKEILSYCPDTYVVHAPHFGPQVAANQNGGNNIVVDRVKFDEIYLQGKIDKLQENLFELSGNFAGNYIAYLFKGKVRSNNALEGLVKISLTTSQTIVLSLNRQGMKKFEGTTIKYSLSPGNHEIKVTHSFKDSHTGCRIQLGVEGDTTATLEVESVAIAVVD
jgi:hypothetical protein